MTLDYIDNSCGLNINTGWGNTDLQGYRKGMYVELFLMFLFFFFTQCLVAFRYKTISSPTESENALRQSYRSSARKSFNTEAQQSILKSVVHEEGSQNKESMLQKPQQKKKQRLQIPWNQKRWNRVFPFMFAFHSVSMGLCLLFSPLPGALIVCYIHLIFFSIFAVLELLSKTFPAKIIKIVLDFLNLSLILIGTVGVNYAQTNNAGTCLVNVY